MIAVPDKAASEYLRAIGAAAVYVVADPWGLCHTGASQDLALAFDSWRQDHFEPKWAGWLMQLPWAQWLAAAPQRHFGKHGNISALSWEQVLEMIQSVATITDHRISDHAMTISNATQMAQQARINFDELKREGALSGFNTAYKKYNEACRAKNERAISYSSVETELFNSVCCIVSTGAKPLSADVLADVKRKFPFLKG